MDIRRVRSIEDVLKWNLCVGCGVCAHLAEDEKVRMSHLDTVGIRPRFLRRASDGFYRRCLKYCPGYRIDASVTDSRDRLSCVEKLVGPVKGVWEGYASDPALRYQGSSGGAVSAIAAYCLEERQMSSVLHTAMDPACPWRSTTVLSRTRAELLARAGSRYSPSSPCADLKYIEESPGPCVFIGKPCDTAAVLMLARERAALSAKLGLTMAFFCAGTPSTQATLDLLDLVHAPRERTVALRYRGAGWPGSFVATLADGTDRAMSYEESWGRLQAYRQFRCQLCPDGLGQIADVSCGDAWHRYSSGDPGRSLIVARTERGLDIVRSAEASGLLVLKTASARDIVTAQGLVHRREELYGRLLALRLMGVPSPRIVGFYLWDTWRRLSMPAKVRSVMGTMRRVVVRGLWRPRRSAEAE